MIAACGTGPKRVEPDNLYWPMPPEQPRVKYIQSIYAEDDIGREYSFKEFLFGKAYIDNMMRPYGVFGRQGRIIASDIGFRAVFVFDLNAKRLSILGGEGAVQMPSAVAQDSSGNIYVADPNASKIAIYDQEGIYKTAYLLPGIRPVSFVISEALGRIYVADFSGHRIVALSFPNGQRLFEFGTRGFEDGRFNMPLDITVDKQGKVYVLDSGNFRIQIFDSEGRFVRKFGSVGDAPGMFARPKGIALDSDGHIYVTDAAFNNFQIFDQEGNVLLNVGRLGPWPGYMHLPAGIAIDENDRIYIADQLNGRIEVFQYLKEK